MVTVAVYLGFGIFVAFFSEGLIFQPQAPGYRDDSSILKLTSADGARISAKYLPNPTAKYTILYSHGNAEDIGDDAPLFERLRNAGFAVFAYDYLRIRNKRG